MVVRLVHADRGSLGRLVAARVATLTQGRSVLVVSARLPAHLLRQELERAGADVSRVFILDVSGQTIAARPLDPEHEALLSGPAMLELITKRTQQIIRAKAERPVTVVTDDMATFSHYSPAAALVEAMRQAMAARAPTTTLEYVCSGGEPAELLRMASALVEDQFDLVPSGELAKRADGSGPVDVGVEPQARRIQRDQA